MATRLHSPLTSQQELADAAGVLDLREHGLHRLFSEPIADPPPARRTRATRSFHLGLAIRAVFAGHKLWSCRVSDDRENRSG